MAATVTTVLHRPTAQEIERAIVDVAAGLMARPVAESTSLQSIAEAAGYSKAGVLHHFTSKDAVVAAVVARCEELVHDVRTSADRLPLGRERDEAVVTALAGLADQQPGCAALLLASATLGQDSALGRSLHQVAADLFAAFGVGGSGDDVARTMAVTGALGALAVCTLACKQPPLTPDAAPPAPGELLPLVVATALAVLSHPAPRP